MTQTADNPITGLRDRFRGDLVEPADAAYDESRKVWNGNIDRRPRVVAHCLDEADVQAAVRFATARGPGDRRPGRSPQHVGGLGGRRRDRDRPQPDEPGPGRPGGAARGGGRRRAARRRRRRDPGPRPRRPRRAGQPHRRGWPDPRWRDGLADQDGRAHHRQHGLGPRGHRRRRGAGRLRVREPGPVLGDPRRRRQLRRGHRVRVRPARGRTDDPVRPPVLVARPGRRHAAARPRRDRRAPRGRQRHGGRAQRATGSRSSRSSTSCSPGTPRSSSAPGAPSTTPRPLAAMQGGPQPLFAFATPMPYVELQKMLDEANAWGLHCYDKGCYVDALSDDVIEAVTSTSPTRPRRCRSSCSTGSTAAFSRVPEDATAFSGGRSPRFAVFVIGVCPVPEMLPAERDWVRAAGRRAARRVRRRRLLRQRGHRLRRARSRRDGVRPGEVRQARGDQADLRPGQRLPPQREHPARERPDQGLPDATSRLSRPGPRRYRRAPRGRGGGAWRPSRRSWRWTTIRSSPGR